MVHLLLHLLVPGLLARMIYPLSWLRAWGVMAATMAVDLDHLLSRPIFDPNRCSIGFHPLHSYLAIGVYTLLLGWPRLRVVATGLLLHMALDYLDCL